MIPAGLLRERLAFDIRTQTPGVGGVAVGDWALAYGPVSARVVHRRGGEGVLAGRLQGDLAVEITIRGTRAAKALTTDWRARDTRSGATYNIKAIQPLDERGDDLLITAQTGKPDG